VRKPQLVALTSEEEREAVELLADLIGAAAAKRRPGVMGGVLDGVSAGAFPGVARHIGEPVKAGGAE
jgi:hypothetical protein